MDTKVYIPYNTITQELLTDHSFSRLEDLKAFYEGLSHVIALTVTVAQILDLAEECKFYLKIADKNSKTE